MAAGWRLPLDSSQWPGQVDEWALASSRAQSFLRWADRWYREERMLVRGFLT